MKCHPFFHDIDWNRLIEKKLQPPFIPKIKYDTYTGYFETVFTNIPIDESLGKDCIPNSQ